MHDPPTLPRILAVAWADRLHITRGRIRAEVRRGNWVPLCRGIVLTRPDVPTRNDMATAGLILGGPGSVVSGWDVSRHYGVGPSRPVSERVLILMPDGTNRLVANVRLRRTARFSPPKFASANSPFLPGLRIAGPARAVADTALDCTNLPSAQALVTAAVQRGICTPDELGAEYLAGPRQGSYFLRRALDDLLDGARSVAEAMVIAALRKPVVPAFEVNVPVLDSGGRTRYIVDILWRSLRAVLEVDSREHHFLERDWLSTMSRHNALSRAGFAVTHWAPAAIRQDPEGFAHEVSAWLNRRAKELGVGLPPGCGPLRPPAGSAPPPLHL